MLKLRHSQFLVLMSLIITFLAGCQSAQDSLYQTAINFERTRADLDLKEVSVGDMNHALLEGGNPEGDTILMVHGFSADKDNWLRLAAKLSDDYHIIAVDLVGHGESSSDKELDYRIVPQAERLHQLMKTLQVDPVHFMGNSMGGAIGLVYAGMYPEQLKSLVLLDNAGITSPHTSEYFQLLEKGENPLIPKQPGDYDFMIDFITSEPPFMPWPISSVLERRSLERRELNEQVFADLMKSQDELGNPEQINAMLATIHTPTLVIWGEEDRVLDVSSVDVMKAHMPNIQSVILSDVGHIPMLEDPDSVADAFLAFTRQL